LYENDSIDGKTSNVFKIMHYTMAVENIVEVIMQIIIGGL
tara:strand:+ start:149 stop:268 length:120 start_codon:yes stop_codon:yes gene_type:complete